MAESFGYDSPELVDMIGARVLRIWDHEHLDSVLPDYVRCEPYERSAFEQSEFRVIWEHREGSWDWDAKQPSAKERPEYHLVRQVCNDHCNVKAVWFIQAPGREEVFPG